MSFMLWTFEGRGLQADVVIRAMSPSANDDLTCSSRVVAYDIFRFELRTSTTNLYRISAKGSRSKERIVEGFSRNMAVSEAYYRQWQACTVFAVFQASYILSENRFRYALSIIRQLR
ncbi:hypothetical protein EVAR_94698_1 [Eumeta japonica]|uniref:Uncharacterized protein n=1 Tax=Eumeta variegata TaxID=151549 RepID=A0A4C1UVQ4_EUMVA|nr:hypothetical protein EVAR_94698_1 [Eumeta japonica]